MNELHCGSYRLNLSRPLIMGIVNLTDDSFSLDGVGGNSSRALARARMQWEAGADILDLGAESTRPGAPELSESEELERLLPVLEEISKWDVPVSVDTYKPGVMRAALSAGASFINDISGLRHPEAVDVLSSSDCGICVMHMQGMPATMQAAPAYGDVLHEVVSYLNERVEVCLAAGISRDRLVIDPGFGFGKTFAHNLALFRGLSEMAAAELPVLVGVSRKSMLGTITGKPVGERIYASVAAALLAAERGAKIIRVHDVAATKDALQVLAAINDQGECQ